MQQSANTATRGHVELRKQPENKTYLSPTTQFIAHSVSLTPTLKMQTGTKISFSFPVAADLLGFRRMPTDFALLI